LNKPKPNNSKQVKINAIFIQNKLNPHSRRSVSVIIRMIAKRGQD
jgi:hypothetical protein